MLESVSRQRYLSQPPSWKQWEQVVDSWFMDTQIVQQHNRRFVRDATPEILLLKYIYAHKLTVAENALAYHIEHVIPVDQLTNALEEIGGEEKWPINCVGNLALLRATENTRKGNKTFREYWDSALASGQITELEHQNEILQMADQLICPIGILPLSITGKNYEDFLYSRYECLKEAFHDAWRDRISDS